MGDDVLQSRPMPVQDWMTWDETTEAYEKTRGINGKKAVAFEVANHNGEHLYRFLFSLPEDREPFRARDYCGGYVPPMPAYVHVGQIDE